MTLIAIDGRGGSVAKARINTAIASARTDWVALLDDRLQPDRPDWIDRLRAAAGRDAAAVGACVLGSDGGVADGGLVPHLGEIRRLGGLSSGEAGRLLTAGRQAGALSLYAVLVRRDAFLLAGGLSDAAGSPVPAMVNLCLRWRAAGWPVLWTPEAVVRGYVEDDLPEASPFLAGAWGSALDTDPAVPPGLAARLPAAVTAVASLHPGGHVDVAAHGFVHGWAWRPDIPSDRAEVELFADGHLIATARADRIRPDLAAAGIGDGGHGFALALPASLMDGRDHRLAIRLAGGGWLAGSPLTAKLSPPQAGMVPVPVGGGRVDALEGRICRGWAKPAESERWPVHVEAVVTGRVVATTVADQPRLDLSRPDEPGSYGFVLELPIGLFDGSAVAITVRRASGGVLDGGLLAIDAARSAAFRAGAAAVRAALHPVGRAQGPTVLYTVHDGAGGVSLTTDDLTAAMRGRVRPLLLQAGAQHWDLSCDGQILETIRFPGDWYDGGEPAADRGPALLALCRRHGVALVHARSLIGIGPDALPLLRQAAVPVVFSFHDFQTLCPTIFLTDDRGWYCDGTCTPGAGRCPVTSRWFSAVPPIKHAHVAAWRDRMARGLAACDVFVTTSIDTRDRLCRRFPFLSNRAFHIIEHGRDAGTYRLPLPAWRPGGAGEPIPVLCPGSLNAAKGLHRIAEVMLLNRRAGDPFAFHFLGELEDRRVIDLGGIHYGSYRRDEFAGIVSSIHPALSLILPIWPETYCHTLSESWLCGLPVVGADHGVLRERITRHGGGWLADPWNPAAVFTTLQRAADPAEQAARRDEAARLHLPSVADMAENYLAIYHSLMDADRPV